MATSKAKRPARAKRTKPDVDHTLRDEILAVTEPVDVMRMLLDQFQPRIAKSGVAGLVPIEKLVLSMWDLVLEVENGGFIQYFFNSSGDLARDALKGLRAIGAPKHAALLERVMKQLGKPATSPDRDTRIRALARFDESDHLAFEKHSDTYLACARVEPLWELTAEYCRAHRDELRITSANRR